MIRRNGAQQWKNIHATFESRLDDLIDVDNASPDGTRPVGFDLFRQAAHDLDALVREARDRGKRIRALGSAWALTDIAVTRGWLVNTKLLNGCFDVSNRYFDDAYPQNKRPYLVLAQCGASIGELNVFLEVTATPGFPRALKTSGIGAGQTVAGAISGNTHGAAVNFGATPDWVAGLQVVTGGGTSLWIERASHPVLNDDFVDRMGAERIRDDDVFNAAVVSFGAFGIITAVAIETDPIYQLKFPPIAEIRHDDLRSKLNAFNSNDPPDLYHYEFIFDPYSAREMAMEAPASRVPFEPGHPPCELVWIARSDAGYAVGDRAATAYFALPGLSAQQKTAVQFRLYREKSLLNNCRATPGQAFTATISYFEGNTESAFGVSIRDAARMMEVSTAVIKDMRLPSISQVRIVHASKALLGFTQLEPKTVIFEFGLPNNATFGRFERNLIQALNAAGIRHTLHWSKNSGISQAQLTAMYGSDRVARWRAARRRVFNNDASLMRVFDNDHLERAGLV